MKANTISNFRSWKDGQLKIIQTQERELAEQLLKAVPENFQRYFQEEIYIIPNLLEHGCASRKYNYNEGNIYDYTSLEEFAQRFTHIKIAWQEFVEITINWDGDHRFEVIFTAK